MLVNKMLFSSAAWYNLSEQNLRSLERVDESLLSQILSAHSKTPTEALYLELGCVPIRFKLMAKRVKYLHYLLNQNGNDLVNVIKDITDNDLMDQIQEDRKNVKLIKNKNINKIFFVKNRLINILLK